MMADDTPLFDLPAESADSTRRDYASIRERASLTRFRAHIRHFSSSAARADSAGEDPQKRRYTGAMHVLIALLFAFPVAGVAVAQERPVPSDSTRITVPGCAKDRLFVVGETEGRENTTTGISPGRRFRLSGPRSLLDDIKKREGSMVEITGLVRKSDVAGPGGVTFLGGRVRVGGTTTSRDPIRDPMYNQIVIDVEGFQVLPDRCPSR